jgi:hypothetical protein
MVLGHLDRLLRGIDPGDLASQPRELLGEQAAAGADVEHAQSLEIEAELLGEDAAHVAEADRVDPGAQEVQEATVLP